MAPEILILWLGLKLHYSAKHPRQYSEGRMDHGNGKFNSPTAHFTVKGPLFCLNLCLELRQVWKFGFAGMDCEASGSVLVLAHCRRFSGLSYCRPRPHIGFQDTDVSRIL